MWCECAPSSADDDFGRARCEGHRDSAQPRQGPHLIVDSNVRTRCRRAGAILVLVGAVDVALMVHAIVERQGYKSSLNIFAIAAGAFLLRANRTAARLTLGFGCVLASMATFGLIAMLVSSAALRFQLRHFEPRVSFVLSAVVLVGLFAVVALLSNDNVIAWVREDMASWKRRLYQPWLLLGVGAALGLLIAGFMHRASNSDDAKLALRVVAARYPDADELYLTGLRTKRASRGQKVTASVLVDLHPQPVHVNVEWHAVDGSDAALTELPR